MDGHSDSFGRMHIPSCDFSTMISQDFFNEFGLPLLQREVKTMTQNVFHMDGKGVARHLDSHSQRAGSACDPMGTGRR